MHGAEQQVCMKLNAQPACNACTWPRHALSSTANTRDRSNLQSLSKSWKHIQTTQKAQWEAAVCSGEHTSSRTPICKDPSTSDC